MIYDESAYERAIRRNILTNAQKTFYRTYPRAQEVADFLIDNTWNDFFKSMYDNLFLQYGKLTAKQYEAVCKSIDKAHEKRVLKQIALDIEKQKSDFVGVEGKRIVFKNILVEKVITIDAPQFHYRDRNTQEIYLLKDENDNRIIYRSKYYYPQLVEGAKIDFKATVKEHKEYKGEKQTVVQRLAF